MTEQFFGQVLTALKMGKYKMCQTTLYSKTYDAYCILGVISIEKEPNMPPNYYVPTMVWPKTMQEEIMRINDGIYGFEGIDNFKRVIATLESEPEYWITE